MVAAASHTPRSEEEYQALLSLLRTSDASVSGIDLSALASQQGRASTLGSALTSNSTVSFLQLDLDTICTDEEIVTESCFSLLLHYIRFSDALRTVSLLAARRDHRLDRHVIPIVYSIVESRGLIALELHISGDYLSLPTSLVQRATNIKDLSLTLIDEDFATEQEQLMMARAFGANQSLEILTLYSKGSGDVTTSVLSHLYSHPKLHSLFLAFCGRQEKPSLSHFHALERLVQSSCTSLTLSFHFYHMYGEGCQGLLSALSVSSCKMMCFNACTFDQDATGAFVRFVKEINPGSGLVVGTDVSFERKTFSNVMATSLNGSLLTALFLRTPRTATVTADLTEMFDTLATNHSKISLFMLQIGKLNASEAGAFARFIPGCTTLRCLEVDALGDGVDHLQFVNAIRRNGCLHHVTMESIQPMYNALLAHVVERNTILPVLVSHPKLQMLLLYPALFGKAQETRQMAPNTMLIGLVAVGDLVTGPRCGTTRSSSGSRTED